MLVTRVLRTWETLLPVTCTPGLMVTDLHNLHLQDDLWERKVLSVMNASKVSANLSQHN